jgi:LPXTG-motif cell wall-anchored protein
VNVRSRDSGTRYTTFVHDPESRRAGPGTTDFPAGLGQREVAVLGWVDETHVLGRAMRYRDPTGADHPSELVLVELGEEPSYDVVGEVDPDIPDLLVATDLVAPDRPTVERPEPDWPWTTQRWLLTLGLPLLGLALVAGAALLVRRRRHRL